MKKLILIALCMVFIGSAFGQHRRGNGEIKWLSLAIKGGYGGSLLFNSDVMADNNVSISFLSPSYSYGGRFGITYGDHIGLNFEPLFSGFSQEYNIDDGVSTYTKIQKFKSLDYFVSLRYISSYGFYFEVGPQFSTLKSASVENSKDGSFTSENGDYMAKFSEKFTSLTSGLGFAVVNGDRLQVNLGLRGSYTFGDFVIDDNYYVLNDGVYNPTGTFTSSTNPFTLKLMVEVNYFFGFWGDATCGKGRLMFFQ
jgi:hypothetical protein